MSRLNIVRTDKPFAVFSLEADKDYLLARLINLVGAGFSSRAGYFAQQALEKYLKAFSVQVGQEYLKDHDLVGIANHISKFNPVFLKDEFIKKLKVFDNFREVGRYGAESGYDPLSKKTKGFQTAGVSDWIGTNIKILDELVFEIRKELDFGKAKFSDSLKAIQEGNTKDYLVSTWKLPIGLQDILATDNDFFQIRD